MTIDLDLQTLLNMLLLLGVLQGIIVACLLFFVKKPGSISNYLLAGWILTFALSNLKIIISTEDLYQIFGQQFTLMLPFSFELFYGPLFFLFIRKATNTQKGFRLRQLVHLIPGVLEFCYYLILYFQPLDYKQWFYGQIHWKWVEPGLEILAVASFSLYLMMSIQVLKRYKNDLTSQYATSDMETYDWLRKLVYVLLSLLGIWAILTFVDIVIMGYRLEYLYFYPYYLALAYLSYFIGYAGYFRPNPIYVEPARIQHKSKTVIDDSKVSLLKEQLTSLMNEQNLFLNPLLKASDIAKEMNISVQVLSYVINKGLNQSFNDYINKIRVDHVKEELANADLKKLSLMGVATASGFNSESSFYRIFKKHTGLTPRAYVQSLKKNQ